MRTIKYTVRRLLLLVPQMFLISVITFVLVRMLPGDPARLELGPLAPQAGVDLLRKQMRLDEPLPQQYIAYLERLLHGDFGRSWVNASAVSQDLLVRVPATLELISAGMLLVFLVMVPIALVSANPSGGILVRMLRRGSFGYGMLAGALPDFWLGLVLIFIFFSLLGWAPGPEGRLGILDVSPDRITGFYTVDSLLVGDLGAFRSALAHLVLPAVTLAFVYGAPIFKMVQSSMEGAMRADYTTYAFGLGLPRRTVLFWAMRNAAPPAVVMTGVVTGFLLGGAVLIETVFNLNGLGQYAVQAITTADYAPVQAFVLVAAVFTMLVYLMVDLVYFMIDPRVAAGTK
ncbi:MAG: ABC transporter permease [Alphaproteobacteria bacterium]|nr:ABC transporter permease [Alphaproteobacteria bacterium]